MSLVRHMSPPLLPTVLAQTGIEKEVWQRTRKVIREAKGTFSPGIGLKQGIAQANVGFKGAQRLG